MKKRWLTILPVVLLLMACRISCVAEDGMRYFTTFTTQNILGETVTEAILQEKDLTVVNIWTTWCNPCLNEMPALAQWEKELPENVQILYLCQNLKEGDEVRLKTVQTIAEKTGVDPAKVLVWTREGFIELERRLTAYPTTLFVNRDGRFWEYPIVGAYVEGYQKTVDALVKVIR